MEFVVVGCSSEDPVHPSSNLLSADLYREWRTNGPQSKATVDLSFPYSTKIKSFEIVNSGSVFIEVLVGKNGWEIQEYQVLLPMMTLMTMSESKSGLNAKRNRLFDQSKMTPHVQTNRWDRVRIVLSQPFPDNSRPIGLSRIAFNPGSTLPLPPQPQPQPENSSNTNTNNTNNTNTNDIQTPPKIERSLTPLISTPLYSPQESLFVEPRLTPTPPKPPKKTPYGQLLKGVVVSISGIENPARGKVRDLIIQMGGEYSGNWTSECTHLICAFAGTPKYEEVRKKKGIIVRPDWVYDSHKKEERMRVQDYFLKADKPQLSSDVEEESNNSNNHNNNNNKGEKAATKIDSTDEKKPEKKTPKTVSTEPKKKKKKKAINPEKAKKGYLSDTDDDDNGEPDEYDLNDSFIANDNDGMFGWMSRWSDSDSDREWGETDDEDEDLKSVVREGKKFAKNAKGLRAKKKDINFDEELVDDEEEVPLESNWIKKKKEKQSEEVKSKDKDKGKSKEVVNNENKSVKNKKREDEEEKQSGNREKKAKVEFKEDDDDDDKTEPMDQAERDQVFLQLTKGTNSKQSDTQTTIKKTATVQIKQTTNTNVKEDVDMDNDNTESITNDEIEDIIQSAMTTTTTTTTKQTPTLSKTVSTTKITKTTTQHVNVNTHTPEDDEDRTELLEDVIPSKTSLKPPSVEELKGKQYPVTQLPNFFRGVQAYFSGVDTDSRKLLTRYVIAYGGKVNMYLEPTTTHAITPKSWDHLMQKALKSFPTLQFIKPNWIIRCHENQKLVPPNKEEIVSDVQ